MNKKNLIIITLSIIIIITSLNVSAEFKAELLDYVQNTTLSGDYDIIFNDNLLYVVSTTNRSINIINATNPGNLEIIDTYINSSLNFPYHLAFDDTNNILYSHYTAGVSSGISVFNVTDPYNIVQLNSYVHINMSGVTGLKINTTSKKLYVINTYDTFTILNITNPSNITQIGSFSNTTSMTTPYGLYIYNDDVAYIENFNNQNFVALNITNPSTITQISTLNITNNGIVDIEIKDNVAYLLKNSNYLYLVNVTDPYNMSHLYNFSYGTYSTYDFFIDDNFIFIKTYGLSSLGFRILDYTNISNIYIKYNYTNSTLFSNNPGKIISNEDYFYLTDSTKVASFLITNPQLQINIIDENTGLLINDSTTTITLQTNTSEVDYTTTDGTYFFNDIESGTYTVKLDNDIYGTRTYTATINYGLTTLNAYLSNSSYNVVFTIIDSNTQANIEGATMTMYSYVNGSLELIESHLTDIVGKAQYSFIPSTRYSFEIINAGYETKTFILDPIMYTTYTIALKPSNTQTMQYADIYVSTYATDIRNNSIDNFTITITSPKGSISSYYFNISYPKGNVSVNGSNANGEALTSVINITGAGYYDTLNLTGIYYDSYGNGYSINKYYSINFDPAVNNTIISNIDKISTTYGFGWFERVLIATLITILFAGLIGMFAGSLIGSFFAMGFYTYFYIIDFLNIYMYILFIFGAGIIILYKSRDD
jgi:hypothetical protein